MRIEEAEFIGKVILSLSDDIQADVLNIGSSTKIVREVVQPHVHHYIFQPLADANVSVVHADLKEASGVDVAGDLFDPVMQEKLAKIKPGVVLACNLMEHLVVESRDKLPTILDKIITPRGVLILTVPYSYPIHYDPIDTYYRPSPQELCDLFPGYDVIENKVIVSSSFGSDLISSGVTSFIRTFARLCFPFYHFHGWVSYVHRFKWLFRPYLISCVVLRKPS